MTLQNLKFDERGLIPAIVQDRLKGRILTFSYMNAEALALTLQTGVAYCWNPDKRGVLKQTDTAGRSQRVVDIVADREGNGLIIKVDAPTSPPSSGEEPQIRNSILEREMSPQEVSIVNMGSMEIGLMLSELFQLIVDLKRERPENSYTAHLFESGVDIMLKKLNQQVMEATLAAKNNAQHELSNHVADLLYHLLVLMVECELDLREVLVNLEQRAGLVNQPLFQEHDGA